MFERRKRHMFANWRSQAFAKKILSCVLRCRERDTSLMMALEWNSQNNWGEEGRYCRCWHLSAERALLWQICESSHGRGLNPPFLTLQMPDDGNPDGIKAVL